MSEIELSTPTAGKTVLQESEYDRKPSIDDETTLRRLGKKPQLSRSFGFMSALGLSCTTLISWEGALVASVPAILNGGPAGVIYGFIANWIGMTSVYFVLGEMASIAPTAGGQCTYPTTPPGLFTHPADKTHVLQITGSPCWHQLRAATSCLI